MIEPKIYKLLFASKEEGVQLLRSMGVLGEENDKDYSQGTHGVIYVGSVPKTLATFDEEANELTPTVFHDGYAIDVKQDNHELDFGVYEISPDEPYHVM